MRRRSSAASAAGRSPRPGLAKGSSRAPVETLRLRQRVAGALERCSDHDRLVLALLLVERLSSSEAADALGVSVEQVGRTYRRMLASLGRAARRDAAPALPAEDRPRRVP